MWHLKGDVANVDAVRMGFENAKSMPPEGGMFGQKAKEDGEGGKAPAPGGGDKPGPPDIAKLFG